MQQRQVTEVVTLLADSDERAKAIIEATVMTDGSALDYEIVNISDVPTPEPENPLGR
jgi:hypothetical protein